MRGGADAGEKEKAAQVTTPPAAAPKATAPPAAAGPPPAAAPLAAAPPAAAAAPPAAAATPEAAPPAVPGAVSNPLYGVTHKEVKGIYKGVTDDKTAKDVVRIGIIVSLGYLIKQLQLESSGRSEDGIKEATEDVLEHLEIIKSNLNIGEDTDHYTNRLLERLYAALEELQKYQSSEKDQNKYTQHLPTLREAFTIFKDLDDSMYKALVLQRPEGDFKRQLTAAELKYGTRQGVTDADYLTIYAAREDGTAKTKEERRVQILQLAEELEAAKAEAAQAEAQADAEPAPKSEQASESTGGGPVYVRVTRIGEGEGKDKFEAVIGKCSSFTVEN